LKISPRKYLLNTKIKPPQARKGASGAWGEEYSQKDGQVFRYTG